MTKKQKYYDSFEYLIKKIEKAVQLGDDKVYPDVYISTKNKNKLEKLGYKVHKINSALNGICFEISWSKL
jgi:hypothetical protein